MHTPDIQLGDRGYEPAHIDDVLTSIENNFSRYLASFAPEARELFREAINSWEDEHPDYVDFLDLGSLEEYDDDPSAFKGALRSKCPIIRRSLNSPGDEMKKYKKAFNLAKGGELLETTKNIAVFGELHMQTFDDATHEMTGEVDDLGLAELLEEDYVAYGVIGGGIRSHFLYALYPHAFPNRSRPAVWALYFLSGKDDFGFVDDSEFLMIDVDKTSTQQNYHYPYDLFAFYSLKVYVMLKDACVAEMISLRDDRRYVYLNAFFDYVHDQHQEETKLLKGSPEDGHGY